MTRSELFQQVPGIVRRALGLLLGAVLLVGCASALVVPRLVNFSGRATDSQNKPISGAAGVTFAIYKDQYDGAPLWIETQNVQADGKGNYSVQLGATKSEGLPLELFASGEARWLGVRINGGEEQPRVLLLSVPYALKAADAETVGGLPPSAFVLAAPSTSATDTSSSSSPASASGPGTSPNLGGSGAQNYLPLWTDNNGTLGNSVFYQLGSGSSAKVGLNLKAPLATLDVNGTTLIRGTLEPVTRGYATASKGFNSNPLDLEASSFSSSIQQAVMQHFEWQAEPTGNNTATPGATLNLLFGQDTAKPAETGLKLSKAGVFTFAAGQTFPGAGTVTSVGLSAPASDFTVTGSPITNSGILGLNWSVAPSSSDTANAIVKRDASGNFSASNINVAGVVATSPGGIGVWGETTGSGGGADGVHGVAHGAGSGVTGVNDSTSGVGVWAQGAGLGLYGISSGSQGIWGETYATGFSNGSGPDGVHGVTHSASGSGVGGLNWADGGVGVWGEAPTGIGFYTPNNVQQARTAGGWVKALLYVDAYNPPYKIARCFNSYLTGAAATTPPCGFNFTETALGNYLFDFGFEVDDRFVLVTLNGNATRSYVCLRGQDTYGSGDSCNSSVLTSNQAYALLRDTLGSNTGGVFYLTVY